MSDDLIRRSDAINVTWQEPSYTDAINVLTEVRERIKDIPSAEPNLILPERMERGECYEVGETIVVMNHDDYYDLLCGAMENEPKKWFDDGFRLGKQVTEYNNKPKQKWIPCSERLPGLGISVIVSYKDEVWHDFLELVDGECIPFWYMSGESIGKTAWMPLPEPWKGADDE